MVLAINSEHELRHSITQLTKSYLVDLDRECLAHESASQGRQNTLHPHLTGTYYTSSLLFQY